MRARSLLVVPLLLIATCTASSRSPSPNHRATDAAAGDLPREAFALLNRSTEDSCSVCARESRAEAFELLEAHYRPGMIIRSDSANGFMRTDGGENELTLVAYPGDAPSLTFRFHTSDDHLVGIAAADMTEESIAERCLSFPVGAAFDGALQIIEFAYGDGTTFLYFASTNHLQLHCRILEIDG